MAGVLKHARGLSLLTNPTITSYKRLVPGFEAPCYIAWSAKNRSPLIRVPFERGAATRSKCATRTRRPIPYLAYAGALAAGLEGIRGGLRRRRVNKNIYTLSEEEKKKHMIRRVPQNLFDAINDFKEDPLMREVLGNGTYEKIPQGQKSRSGPITPPASMNGNASIT